MSGIDGFDVWYEAARKKLSLDRLARHFVELRNDEIHKGRSALNQATTDHLHEILLRQFAGTAPSHFLLVPDPLTENARALIDAADACLEYLVSLVRLVFDCYKRFKAVVDPQWHLTAGNYEAMGKTFQDAMSELGSPAEWAAAAPPGEEGWRAICRQQQPCALNRIFSLYLGEQIAGPDD